MPRRHPQPFWRNSVHCWYVQIGKKQYRLAPDREEAFRLYHDLMGRKPEENPPSPPVASLLVIEVLDAFLEWTKTHQAEKTFTWHRDNIQKFAAAIPSRLAVTDLKPYHVTRVMDSQLNWSNSTKNGFARSVQRAMRWAEKQGIIDRSPISQVEKPGPESRELIITPAEFDDLLARFPDQEFRDVLITTWETGCRPQELMRVEARHVDLQNNRWAFGVKESKGNRVSRIVYLTDRAAEITRRLAMKFPTGPLFRNANGQPWDEVDPKNWTTGRGGIC